MTAIKTALFTHIKSIVSTIINVVILSNQIQCVANITETVHKSKRKKHTQKGI